MDVQTLYTLINKPVMFGSRNGLKNKGTILKVNAKRCRIRQDDERGKHPKGTIWNVPHNLIYQMDANGNALVPPAPVLATRTGYVPTGFSAPPHPWPPVPPTPKVPITDFWIMDNQHELIILGNIYGQLSPENLCGDGEIPRYMVNQKRAELERKLRACFVLMGREIDETEAYDCEQRMEKLIAAGKDYCLFYTWLLTS